MPYQHFRLHKAPGTTHGGRIDSGCVRQRLVAAFAMAILLIGACPLASGQIGDLYKKAREKALQEIKKRIDDKIDKAKGSDAPTTSSAASAAAAGQSSAPPSAPDATKKTGEAQPVVPPAAEQKSDAPRADAQPEAEGGKAVFTYCHSFVPNVARYYSGVFSIGQAATPGSSEGKAIAQQFRDYVLRTYGDDPKAMSEGSCIPGMEQSVAQERLDKLQAHQTNTKTKLVFTDWRWDGQAAAAAPSQ